MCCLFVLSRESVECADFLLQQIEEATLHAAQLADTRRLKLQQCLQLRLFEDQSSQVRFTSV